MPVRLRPEVPNHYREVAQLGRVPALGAGGRRFKSCLPDHYDYTLARFDLFVYLRYNTNNRARHASQRCGPGRDFFI